MLETVAERCSKSHKLTFKGLNHTAVMLSPEGSKTFVFTQCIRSKTFQLEARGPKSIVYGQYGRRAKKAR